MSTTATTVTPPALQPSGSSAGGAPTAKERRYDRQLRLWAASGQRALEEAHLLLFNGGTGAVGTETLKNLVLPGMGSFTIVDPATACEEDLGVNFFLEEESLGKSRATECVRLLGELNPDVVGKGVQMTASEFLTSADLSKYSIILTCGPLPAADLANMRKEAWIRSVPLVMVYCAGFYSYFTIQLPQQFPIVDTHPDPASTQDLRLLAPWPELAALAASKTAGLESMSDHDHGHVPYLLLLLHYLEQWKSTHDGSLPTVYKDKTAFRDQLVRAGARTDNAEGGEENYDEAVSAVLKSLNEPTVPSGLRDIFAQSECQQPLAASADFWYIAHAVSVFAKKHGVLPLPGAIPDMKAQSKDYIELQNVYKTKARADVAEVTAVVRELEARLRVPGLTEATETTTEAATTAATTAPIDAREIEAFCKGAAHVKLLHGRTPGVSPPRLAQAATALENEESLYPIYIAFEAINTLLSGHNPPSTFPQSTPESTLATSQRLSHAAARADIPTIFSLIDSDEGAHAIEDHTTAILARIRKAADADREGDADDEQFDLVKSGINTRVLQCANELRRAGGVAELHNIASLAGGMVAQEVIKLITRQYVPVDNTCVFDGVGSRTEVFRV